MTREFPQTFAVIKAQANPRAFQFLMATPHWSSEEGRYVHSLENAGWARDLQRTRYQDDVFNELDPCIYTFYYNVPSHPTPIRKFKYWYTPYYFMRNGQRIPVLEFQYKSWLPSGGIRIPIGHNEDHFMDTVNTINQERYADIQNAEQNLTTPLPLSRTRRNRSPPPILRQSPRFPSVADQVQRRLDILDDYHPLLTPRMPLTPPAPPLPLPTGLLELLAEEANFAIPLPAAFQVRETAPPGGEGSTDSASSQRVLPLPKHVGDLLIHHSRMGSESCPILATPYSECETLAVTSCFHVFDSHSLQRWRTDHSTCPICRTHITNVVEES